MQPNSGDEMPDPQALASEFDVPSIDVTPDAPEGDSTELFDVVAMSPGTPIWGVACVEGLPDGGDPKRTWAPGSLVFAPTPFPFKTQFSEEEGHDGAVVSGRVDAIWQDGALIRFVGVLDSAGRHGAETERLLAGNFMRGVSIKADDITEAEVEMIYAPPPGPDLSDEIVELGPGDETGDDSEGALGDEDSEDFHYPGKHDQKSHGYGGKKNVIKPMKRTMSPAERRLRNSHQDPNTRDAMQGGFVADAMPMMGMPARPIACIYHHGRVRSVTMVAEPAWVECTVSLGESPFSPPVIAETSPLAEVEALAMAEAPAPVAVVAAGFSITIPELWPEWWFSEPSPEEMAMVSSGAIQITPEGRVWGLLAPAGVDHRGFRGSGRTVQVPRGVDYSEWQNKACIVAGADGGVYKINAGTVTFGCGHASPTDPRRADPRWAADHYDNSCSVAMRARAGENRYGTWFAGGLNHGLTADAFEQIMGCALSGDWQGGKLKAALLVPCEGFPTAVTASVREKMGVLVASSVPIQFQEPEPDRSLDWAFALVASARFDELADERFDEIAFDENAAERR